MSDILTELRRKARENGMPLVFNDLFARAASEIEDLRKALSEKVDFIEKYIEQNQQLVVTNVMPLVEGEVTAVPAAEPRPPGLNFGHGHVFPREDGVIYRCGGPGLCSECSIDQAMANKLEGR